MNGTIDQIPSAPPQKKFKKKKPPASLNFLYPIDRLPFVAEALEAELPYPDDFLHLQCPHSLHEMNDDASPVKGTLIFKIHRNSISS